MDGYLRSGQPIKHLHGPTRSTMRSTVLAFLLPVCIVATAQWTTPNVNTRVSGAGSVEAATPMSAPGPDGSTYITWFEGASGYRLMMQRLDADGVALWDAGGIVVSDEPQNSALFRFDFKSDHAGNAIVVFQDERSGALDVVLARLGTFMEKAQRLKSRVTAAMVYPAAVLCVAGAVVVLLMVVLVPKFEEIFTGLMNGRPLPEFSMLIINLSRMMQHHFVALLGGLAALVVGVKMLLGTPPGRALFDRLKLRLPGVGPVIRKAIVARVSRTLGTLLSSGVPILQALNIVKETAGNTLVSRALAGVHESVKEGETVAAPLRESGVFPAVVIGMVDVGEQAGALPEMLLKIADNYDEEVDTATAAMTSLLEPVMIVFLALVVGTIVVALFLPIVDVAINMDGQKPDAAE